MLQRLVAIVLGVFGLASISLGVASATAWRADDTLVATASATPTSAGTLILTGPGVLELGGTPVTATARANGGTKVVLAIGKEADVAGWVGTDPHAVISGLSDLTTLRIGAAEPTPEPTPTASPTPADAAAPVDPAAEPAVADPAATAAPDPDGSDLWVVEAAGARTAELTWTPQAGRWTLLAAGAGEGAKAPVVELSWPQTVTTPWLVPGVVVGAVLLALGIALGIRLWIRARRGEQAEWHAVETGAIPIVVRSGLTAASGGGVATAGAVDLAIEDDTPTVILTRRQMREAAATAPTPRVSLRRRPKGSSRDETRPATGSLPAADPAAAPAAASRFRLSPVAAPPVTASSVAASSPAGSGVAVTPVPGRPTTPAGSRSAVNLGSPEATVSTPAREPSTESDPPAGPDGAPASRRTRRSERGRRFGSREAAPAAEQGPRTGTPGSSTPGSSTAATDATALAAPPAAAGWTPDRPTDHGTAASPATPANGSRADAWRRSWGIPDADTTPSGASAGSGSATPLPPAAASGGRHSPADPAAPRSGKDA